jgi:membrane-associated protease RseP (regulator of RpoE activity)
LKRCVDVVSTRFEVLEVSEVKGRRSRDGRPIRAYRLVLGAPRSGEFDEALKLLYRDLASRRCYPYLYRGGEGLVLLVSEAAGDENKAKTFAIAAALAAATLASVYLSGIALSSGGGAWSPLAYVVGLLLPLAIHELGHMAAMIVYGVPRSPPYFIPAPPIQLGFLGTFGAFINLRWLPPTSESLAVIGVMGPVAGFLAAIPLTLIGLNESLLIPESEAAAAGAAVLPVAPLILLIMGSMVGGEGHVIVLSPLAFAGYLVFLITFLNLLPIGSLDGGHVLRGLLSERAHSIVTMASVAFSAALSVFFPPLLVFALLALTLFMMTGGRHPGPSMAEGGSGRLALLSAVAYGVVLVFTMPIPVA